MRIRKAAIWVALPFGLILGGCSASTTQLLTAGSTVKTYLAAVNTQQWKQAMALLSPSQQQTFMSAPDSDRNNTLSVTHVSVRVFPAPFERSSYPGYTSIKQALVTFDATYKKVYGASNGPQVRFVYVGSRGASRPWRILVIGTGP
jgi:hypothetical protein